MAAQGPGDASGTAASAREHIELQGFHARFPSSYYVTPPSSPPSRPLAPPTQRRYFYFDVKPPEGLPTKATILFLHGFPDSSYGWRNILSPVSLSGYRCIVPDLLGYGRTSAPDKETRLAEYGAHAIALDLKGLMETALGSTEEKFAVVGHDWGSWLAWKLASWIPEKLLGVHGIAAAYAAPSSRYLSTQEIVNTFPHFGYQVFFDDPRSTDIIGKQIWRFLHLIFLAPSLLMQQSSEDVQTILGIDMTSLGSLEKFLTSSENPKLDELLKRTSLLKSPQDRAYFDRLFGPERGVGGASIDGALNWYRTRKVNFDEDRARPGKTLPPMPYKILCPSADPTSPISTAEKTAKHYPKETPLVIQEMPMTGHWAMLEGPDTVVQSVLSWMNDEVLPYREKSSTWSGWVRSKM